MSAIFSDDRTHRFLLSRGNESKPYVLFIGLNPSDAGEEKEDPTTRKINTLTKAWGFEHWKIANLSAFVSSKPKKLVKRPRSLALEFKENRLLTDVCRDAEKIVPCWGTGVKHLGHPDMVLRPLWVIDIACLRAGYKLYHLGRTKDGYPKHPLFLSNDTELQPWFDAHAPVPMTAWPGIHRA